MIAERQSGRDEFMRRYELLLKVQVVLEDREAHI